MSKYKAGYIGLLGWPNAGKSTLLNALIEESITIVTPKPQTTRRRVHGIINEDHYQAILVDSPGFVKNEKGLNKFIKKEWESILEDVDAYLMILDLDQPSPEPLFQMVEALSEKKKPSAAVLTKTDKVSPNRVQMLKSFLDSKGVKSKAISALKSPKESREIVLDLIEPLLPESTGPLYSEEIYTTENVKDICSEMVREQCFLQLKQELPYQVAVDIRKFDETPKKVVIYTDIIISKGNHKMMVIGKKGEKIKSIGIQSRSNIEKFLGKKVYLDLHVVNKNKWYENKHVMESLGYANN